MFEADIAILFQVLAHILTMVIAFGTAIVTYHLTKFFHGGVFENAWKILFFVPLLMGLAEVGELLKLTLVWSLGHLAACSVFLYSIYAFYRSWIKLRGQKL